MKAVVFPVQNSAHFTDIDMPKLAANQVLVKVRASGICHTDFEVMRANYGTSTFPIVPGHEYAGDIVDIGADVTTCAIGDRVAVDPNIECGCCNACQRGWTHLCQNLNAYGVTKNGGFAEYSCVDEKAVVQIGDLPFDLAALAEPMGCVLNGMDAAVSTDTRHGLIFGAGPMGLLMAIALRFAGKENVTLVDMDDARLSLADTIGFDTLHAQSDDLKKWHQTADLAVDATGNIAVAQNLVTYVASGGTGLFFGVCGQNDRISMSPFEIFRRQLRLVGTHSLNHNIPAALDIIRASQDHLGPVISHKMDLEAIADVFKSGMPSGSMKVQACF